MHLLLSALVQQFVHVWAFFEIDGFTRRPKPSYFECDHPNCGYWNVSWPLNGTINGSLATDSCIEASRKPLADLHREIGFLAFGALKYEPSLCKRLVCQMYTNITWSMRPHQDGGYYSGCDSLSNFNQTLCPSYPDVEGYCECLWSGRFHFPGPEGLEAEERECWTEITNYLLVGRLLRIYPNISSTLEYDVTFKLVGPCLRRMCEWMNLLGTPFFNNDVDQMYLFPKICGALHLPLNIDQCVVMQNREPYHPCPWKEEVKENNETQVHPDTLYCFKDANCVPSNSSSAGYSCCYPEGRMKCPANLSLCEYKRNCGGGSDSCCEEDCVEIACSPVLVPWSAEWHGMKDGKITLPDDTREPTTTAIPTSRDAFKFGTLFFVLVASSVLFILVLTWGLRYVILKNLSRHDTNINRPKHLLDLFGFTSFAANLGRKVKRNLYKLPKPTSPKDLPENRIILFQKDMRKIAPGSEFGQHKGLPTKKEKRLERDKSLAEKKVAHITEKMKTDFDPVADKKKVVARLAALSNFEQRIEATEEEMSVEKAAELYSEVHGRTSPTARYSADQSLDTTKAVDTSPSKKLVRDAMATTTKIINDADHPVENLVLDRLEGTLKICPTGVTRLVGWFDENGGSIFVGDAVNDQSAVPVAASKPVCKYFQVGKCHSNKCPWLHQKARPGDRLREPIGPRST